MAQMLRSIPIQAAQPQPGCGGCMSGGSAGTVCRAVLGEPCAAPDLQGPDAELRRLLDALAPVLGGQGADGAAQRVRALHVQPGEVDLTLAVPGGCGGALLADAAFRALRRLLPDTDVYVRAG